MEPKVGPTDPVRNRLTGMISPKIDFATVEAQWPVANC